ncbi:MAG: alpha amylase C-terminal domain-containing protein [Alistipes sp.]|jgi:1,4-alpha-glucan branching enzyme|nr:alpha amylase C-terminal domain-containing protein [Alistipes sp.]
MVEKNRRLPIVERDEWLLPVEDEMNARHARYCERLEALAGDGTLSDFANGHRWFGFTRDEMLGGWWFREWLPGAADVFLFGDFNGWQRTELRLERGADGVWSIFLPDAMYADRLVHGSLYKMHVHGANGWHDRIPAYARRVVQNDETKDYTAQFWNPEVFDWTGDAPVCRAPLLIYEAHIGMAGEAEGVGTFAQFTSEVLPRIAAAGYNTVQLMAVAEHPYYGSFGYHVSNFYAVSSRFGTPEDLKTLIKRAHEMGIAVVMDLVHAHYVKNLNEGLAELDGSDRLYSRPGPAGYQPYWDSMLFDYGKGEVTHFLLSNIKFWLTEFRFDGFRFDGVTSMIYRHHGYTEFDSRDKFFGPDVDNDALTYLTLANHLVHELRPGAITIAEDVSGMPGMAVPIADGGVGFDYRLGMAIPDFWIRLLEDVPDEEWDVWEIWNILTDRLPGVGTVAYAESHDQAMVGDKTIAHRLMDAAMYSAMGREVENLQVDRGVALHKMIRLVTIAAGGTGYLNFMGNEFGHPEWIDFPREGNGWSYAHARRQWSLADSPELRYSQLAEFDRAMISLVRRCGVSGDEYPRRLQMDEAAQTMVFSRGRGGGGGPLVFVFNWSPNRSLPDYAIEVPEPGCYRTVLSTDEERFGGVGRESLATEHFTFTTDGRHFMQIYNVCRTAAVFAKIDDAATK